MSSNGFSGTTVHLYPDSTYFKHTWTDMVDGDDPVQGELGTFQLVGDLVVFQFKKFDLYAGVPDERIERTLAAQRKRQHLQRVEVRRIKKHDGDLFLVQPTAERAFAKAVIEGENLVLVTRPHGGRFGASSPLRVDQSQCGDRFRATGYQDAFE